MSKESTRTEQLSKLREMIKDIDICMLTTCETDGSLRSRPMSTQEAETDGELWFFTAGDSGKAEEVRQDRRVNVSYAAPGKNRYVSVSGTAELVNDRKKIEELWKPILKVWFPKGVEDPNLSLLRVSVEQAEYWDDSSSRMVQFFKMVKAAVTGVSYEAENAKLSL